MNIRKPIAIAAMIACSLTFAALAAEPEPAPTSPVTGNAANGKKLFEAYACYSCHGYNGETGTGPAFVGSWGNLDSEASFIAFLRQRADLAPEPPVQSMPNFSAASLPDAKAKDIYAYIRTFRGNTPKGSAPALDAIVNSVKK